MNSKIKLSILIVSISQFSCVEKVDTSKNQQTLVYDSIKTHQARTLLLKSKQSNSVQKRNRYLNTAMLSTSSALLSAGKGLSNQDCSDLGEAVLYGSSNLVSPNRLVSAEHNILNSKSNDWFVTFGGNDKNAFFADADFNSEDENPLLANRLWQIGLDYWAANSTAHQDTRKDLLKWPVEKDLENAMIQPFAQLNKDIVFLKSLSKTNEDTATDLKFKFNTRAQYDEDFRQYITPYQYEGYTDTGTFEIDQPGVFFNQIVLKPYSTSSINYPKAKVPKGDTYVTPLQLLQTPNWDTFTNQGTTVKLRTSVSTVSGFTDHKINTNNLVNCAPIKNCKVQPIQTKNYTGCIRTSLDVISGSSGGSMLSSPARLGDTGEFVRDEYTRYGFGIVSGTVTTNLSDEDEDSWGQSGTVTTLEGKGIPTTDNHTLITVGEIDFEKWGTRSKTFGGEDPFKPIPNEPQSDGKPECIATSGAKKECTFSKVYNNDTWSDPPEADISEFSTDDPIQTNQEVLKTVKILCDYNQIDKQPQKFQGLRTHAGVAIGIIGTATTTYLDNEQTVVANFGPICAPWSSASWTDNWNWLIYDFRSNPLYNSAIPKSSYGKGPAGYELAKDLPFLNEERQKNKTASSYYRPMSMKTCPPNYYLTGLGYLHREKTLVGINYLVCQNKDGKRKTTPLRPKDFPGLGNQPATMYGGYKMNNMDFDLAQHIGNPIASNAEEKEINCPDKQAVAGFQVTKTYTQQGNTTSAQDESNIQGLWLSCTKAPGQ